MTFMTKDKYIEAVAGYVAKYAPQFNIKCYSAVIAQFCLESAYGTSNKVYEPKFNEWRHNYAGLKWRNNRCVVSNEWFTETGSEQDPVTKQYVTDNMKWCKFKSLEECVLGYFQWTNISNYSNLKGVTDYKEYLTLIKADNYATSVNYVQNCCNVVTQWNLTKYDPVNEPVVKKYYRAQVGAYRVKQSAINMMERVKGEGFNAIIKEMDGLYHVQVGAYSKKENAENMVNQLKSKGFNAFVKYC